MTALNMEALGAGERVDVSLELLRRLRDGQVYDGAGPSHDHGWFLDGDPEPRLIERPTVSYQVFNFNHLTD